MERKILRAHVAAAAALSVLLTSLGSAQAPPFQVLDTPVPPFAWADAVGDLDGDGDQDILGGGSTVYLNDGQGRFTQTTAPSLATYGARAVLADVNGDGLMDVWSIDSNSHLHLNLNVGALGFTAAALPPGSGSYIVTNLAVADVDLDGDIDVLLVMNQGVWVQLWKNNGSGGFIVLAPMYLPVGALPGTSLILRDLDNNGYPDAIWAGLASPSISAALNAGGYFAWPPALQWNVGVGGGVTAVDVGDFNADGRLDIVFGSASASGWAVGTIMNSPAGFSPPVVTAGFVTHAVVAVDVNGDGADELLIQSNAPQGLGLHSVAPGGTVGPATQFWPATTVLWQGGYTAYGGPTGADVVRDLDGDNDRDVLANDGPPSVVRPALLMNDGVAGFTRVGGHSTGVAIAAPRIGDVNGDGMPDAFGFAWSNAPTIVTGLNDGDGSFHPGPTSSISLPAWGTNAPAYFACVFDRDGDGDSDLYLANIGLPPAGTTPPYDVVLDNTGGTFAQIATVPTPSWFASAVREADLDGDGDHDIVVGTRSGGGPALLVRNLGVSGFATPMPIGANHLTRGLELGDFDGNGTVDFFQVNSSYPPDLCVLYLNSGNATFTAVTQSFGGTFSAAGHLNNDGMTDVVVDGRVYYSSGGGALIPGPLLPWTLSAPAMLADVDLDGDLDLVQTPATIMLNLGGGTFGPPIDILPRAAGQLTNVDIQTSWVADVDRDGDPDIVAPGPIVVSNVARQIAHGWWARLGRPASIDTYGTPGGPWALFASNGTASFPFPPFGNVLIDPASAVLFATGSFGGPLGTNPGAASLTATVPNNPALVGWTTYWQAVDAAILKATNRITITVQSY